MSTTKGDVFEEDADAAAVDVDVLELAPEFEEAERTPANSLNTSSVSTST
jgi:hypothetical protein